MLSLGVEIRALDTELAIEAGAMFPVTKPHGLSHGDQACSALGIRLNLPVATADGNRSALAPTPKVRVEPFR